MDSCFTWAVQRVQTFNRKAYLSLPRDKFVTKQKTLLFSVCFEFAN